MMYLTTNSYTNIKNARSAIILMDMFRMFIHFLDAFLLDIGSCADDDNRTVPSPM